MSSLNRHTRKQPCPICGGFDGQPRGKGVRCFGFTSEDGTRAHCTRPEFSGGLAQEPGSAAYAHRLGGVCKCGTTHGNGSVNPVASPVSRVVKSMRYQCIDAHGQVVAIHVRRDLEDGGKEFTWERPDGRKGLGGVKFDSLPLYNLPALLAAPKAAPVVVGEGQKMCDALTKAGILAVGTVTGAMGTPREEVLRPLLGHPIYLWPDHDDEGRAHMYRIASALARLGEKPRVIAWLEARDKGDDAADFLERGGTGDGVHSLMKAAPRWEAGVSGQPAVRSILVYLSDVEAVPIRWLWPGRIPLGKLTIFDGDPGLGKSLITLNLAARTSTGREMPDGTRGDADGPGGIVLLSAEDDPSDTIRPRLDAAGGDSSRVVMLTAQRQTVVHNDGSEESRERSVTLRDVDALRHAIKETGARLVIVDPFMAYIGDTDGHLDSDIRALLAPLAALAAETGAAIVLVRHLRKSGGANPVYAGGGSIGIIAAARSGLMVARDPDDPDGHRRVLASTKCNLAVEPPSLGYVIEPKPLDGPLALPGVPHVRWLGQVEHTAASILGTGPEDSEERMVRDDAMAFLRGHLADGPRPVEEVKSEAKRAGFSWRTVERAKAPAKVRSVRDGANNRWLWVLEEGGVGGLGGLDPNGPQTPIDRPQFKTANSGGLGGVDSAGGVQDRQLAATPPHGGLAETAFKPAAEAKTPKAANTAIANRVRAYCPYPTHPRAWRSIHGAIVCATCHAPASDDLVAEWIDEPGGGP